MFCRGVKSVAEQAEEESTGDWVERMRKAQKEKEIAEERVSCAHCCVYVKYLLVHLKMQCL